MLAGRTGRSEDRDGTADPREPVEADGELGGDVANPLGVCGSDVRRLVAQPQQQLLIESRLAGVGAWDLVGHGSRHSSPMRALSPTV